MNVWAAVQALFAAGGDWSPPAVSPIDQDLCTADRACPDPGVHEPPILDLTAKAAKRRYRSGRLKLTRYPPVDLAARRVVIALHQTGFEVGEGWPFHKITAHRVITPAGRRAHLFGYTTRLIAGNRLDREPYFAIHIEVLGNFEEVDGDGRWWSPNTQGRGRASDAQINAVRVEVRRIVCELADLGIEVYGIAPHRIAGYNPRNGRPNRPLCCGSRVWSEAGEWAGAELGLRVPGPGFKFHGMAIPDSWRGRYYDRCESFWEHAA